MKTHSTVSRRDFMKALGIGAAGVGAAAAAAPVFTDLDDMKSSADTGSTNLFRKPWYVKERDFENPTTELDWSLVTTPSMQYTIFQNPGQVRYWGQDRINEIAAKVAKNREDGARAKAGGFLTKDFAFNAGAGGMSASNPPVGWGTKVPNLDGYTGQAGLSKYEGTPEENSQMVKAAMTYFGAPSFGIMKLSGNSKKLCYPCDNSGVPYVWEAAEIPSVQAGVKKILPNNQDIYLLSVWYDMPKEFVRNEYGPYGCGVFTGNRGSSSHSSVVTASMQRFLGYLGYWCYSSEAVTAY